MNKSLHGIGAGFGLVPRIYPWALDNKIYHVRGSQFHIVVYLSSALYTML